MIRIFTASSILCILGASAIAQDRTYTVQPGDTLGDIARAQLGSRASWRELCEINDLDDCDLLLAGQTIRLTDDAEMSSAEAPQAETSEMTSEAETSPEAEPSMEAETVQDSAADDDMSISLAAGSDVSIGVPDGFSVERTESGAVFSGSAASGDPSSTGRTGGISVQLSDAMEQAASGQTITVTIYGASEQPFQAAYSTSDVGNSGWRDLSFTDGSASFSYDVPEMNNGNGDYIGFLPSPNGTGGGLTIERIEIAPGS